MTWPSCPWWPPSWAREALYTLVALFISSRVIDRLIEGVDEARAVTIISGLNQAIATAIINKLERGATIMKGYGAYTGKKKHPVRGHQQTGTASLKKNHPRN